MCDIVVTLMMTIRILFKLLITQLFFVSFTTYGIAQKQKAKNLNGFDKEKYHFGINLAFNSADLFISTHPTQMRLDSIVSIQNYRQPGFNLQIIGSWNWNKNISLRFLPGLSFQECKLEYTYNIKDTSIKIFEKRISPNYFLFPLLMKLRTDRINNFAAYTIGGLEFGIDMASQKKVNNAGANTIVKIIRPNWNYQVGGGIDLFLRYFKLGFELKFNAGINNLLIQDFTKFASPIKSLKSRVWTFSVTFEG